MWRYSSHLYMIVTLWLHYRDYYLKLCTIDCRVLSITSSISLVDNPSQNFPFPSLSFSTSISVDSLMTYIHYKRTDSLSYVDYISSHVLCHNSFSFSCSLWVCHINFDNYNFHNRVSEKPGLFCSGFLPTPHFIKTLTMHGPITTYISLMPTPLFQNWGSKQIPSPHQSSHSIDHIT